MDRSRGEPPPPTSGGDDYLGGHKTDDLCISATARSKKADALPRPLFGAGPPTIRWRSSELIGGQRRQDPRTNDDALSYLRISVKDPDPEKVGRRFSSAAVELALSSYPGFFLTTPPGEATAYAVYWPTTIPASLVPMRVVMNDQEWEVTSVAPETKPQTSNLNSPFSTHPNTTTQTFRWRHRRAASGVEGRPTQRRILGSLRRNGGCRST